MLSTGNEVRRTSPANHPPMWSKWSEQSMPPSVTWSECIPSLRCLLFCHAGPEKVVLWYIGAGRLCKRCWNVFLESTYIFYTLINAYNETVSTLCEFDRLMSSIGLLQNFVHVYFQAESATNLVFSSYRCTAMVPWCVDMLAMSIWTKTNTNTTNNNLISAKF